MTNLKAILCLSIAASLSSCSAEPTTGGMRGAARPAANGSAGAASPLLPSSPASAPSSGPASAGSVIPTPGSQQPQGTAGASTGASNVNGQCGAVTQTAQNTLQPVDIIFSIDTSGSMREEIAFVKENMNAFSKQIRDSGIDVHVILIGDMKSGTEDPLGGLIFTDGVCIDPPLGSGKCPEDSNVPNYVHIVDVIGQWNILDAYITHYPEYKMYLREHSVKTFVSISDADAFTPADAFMNSVKALDPNPAMWANWRYCAIYAYEVCGMSDPGLVHADLVMRTKGVAGDLCKQDFAPVFNEIAKKLVDVVQLACDWGIPAPPSGEEFEPTKTNVQLKVNGASETLLKYPSAAACAMREGWYYDNEMKPSRVVACPTTCARIQAAAAAEISLQFGCATQLAPQ